MAAASKKLQKLRENEIIISEVEKRPPLWDIRLHQYRDVLVKASLWKEVAMAVGCAVEYATTRWQTLRDTFFRKIKEEQASKRSGAGAADVVKCNWPHLQQMMFLRAVSLSKSTRCNLDGPGNEEVQLTEDSTVQTPEAVLMSMINGDNGQEDGPDDHVSDTLPSVEDLQEMTDSSSTPSSGQSTMKRQKKGKRDAPTSDPVDKELEVPRSRLSRVPDNIEYFALSLCDDMRRCPQRLVREMKKAILDVDKYMQDD
ncbi:uncharacterized protein LOC135384903 [Ornithodoros turicata]|uniref:uncharacterized protein LOC135384903 n=1 Tax=Ornithodoros turicata TaxID=34597 RepID=UPI003139AD42